MPTTRKAAAPKSEPEGFNDTVKDVTIDVLVKRAFPYGQWANALDWVDQQSLAPEVAAEIRSAIERNR